MKILLLGEFSGLHTTLKEGLNELGYDSTLVSTGDGWKKLPSDYSWLPKRRGIPGKVEFLFNQLNLPNRFRDFEVVQFISNFNLFTPVFNLDWIVYKKFLENNNKSFCVLAGADPIFWEYWSDLKNGDKIINFIKDTSSIDMTKKSLNRISSAKEKNKTIKLSRSVDGLIPIMFDYAQPYREFNNLKPAIQIPINIHKINFKENTVKNNKIVCFHGLNREGAKGTKYVREAFDILKNKYPNDLELVIAGNMPYAEYITLLEKTNVVVDQTNFYSLGINALLSMAQGKIVLGGCEKESFTELGYDSCPGINITSNVESIVNGIERILEKREEITYNGHQARLFIEKNHNYIDVAEKYLKQWEI